MIAAIGPHLPKGVALHSRPSGRRHRAVRARTPASPTLFDNRWCILTPPHGADPAAVAKRARRSGEALGAKVEMMDADHHDLVLAITSHVPHLIAYNIVGTAADLEDGRRGPR